MDPVDAPVPLERLLAERDWLRALARRLVTDPGAADDAEQETWAAALTARPRRIDAVRGWLAAVLRNAVRDRARSESSRARREAAAARPEATRSTAQVVEQADLQRRLVQAVFDLEAPLRDAVLLRFFEDLSHAEVGARLGVSADAARMRIRRGIERLRERLDQDDDPHRTWRGAIVAWIGSTRFNGGPTRPRPVGVPTPGAAVGALTGGLVMAGTKTVAAAAVAVALLAGVAFWGVSRTPQAEPPPSAPTTADAHTAPPPDTRPDRRRASPDSHTPGAAPAPPTVPDVAPDARPDWPIGVSTNVPGAEVTVTFRCYGALPDPPPATKRADMTGFAGFDLPPHPGGVAKIHARAAAPGHATAEETVRDGRATLTLEPGVPVRGRIVSQTGEPVEGATVTAADDRFARSAADGAFVVWPQDRGPATLRVTHTAYLNADASVTAPADGVEVVLGRGRTLEGRVTFPDLRPLPGASVQAWADGRFVLASTGDDGRYVLSGLLDGEFELTCGASDDKLLARAGSRDADFVVRNAVARIRFVDEEGRPFRNAALWVRGFLGEQEIYSSATAGASDPDHLIDVPPGTRLQISPSAEGYERPVVEVTLDTEPALRDVPVVIRRAGAGGAIELRVVDATGAPRRTTRVSLDNEADAPVDGWYGKELALDATGRARLADLPPGRLRLTVGPGPMDIPTESYDLPVEREVGVSAGSTVPVDATLVPGGRIVARVLGPDGALVAPHLWLTVHDLDGARIPTTVWQPTDRGTWTSSSDPDLPQPLHLGRVLPAGSYTLRFKRTGGSGSDANPIEHPVTVVAGRTTQVELRLDD